MKMKDVCARTELSDRAVRFYMEENLIAPSYTENYLGRRTFDFSEEDVVQLQNIAVLRKFGFSIEEIRTVKEDPGSSAAVLAGLREKKQKTVEDEQVALLVLNRLDTSRSYTIGELAEALSAPIRERELPAEDNRERLGRKKKIGMAVSFLIAVAPVLLPWFWFNLKMSFWSGLSLTRECFAIGCVLALCLLVSGSERQAVKMRLGGSILVLADYVLAFVHFQERANISGAVDLAISLYAARWTYWLACVWLLVFLVRWSIGLVDVFRKK